MAVTFHRAFDMTNDPFAALETLVELGIERVLTSGQEASALEGLPLITELNRQAGDRIIVMPGGAIAPHNVARIVRESGVRELHFAAREAIESKMAFRRAHVFMGGELRTQEFERHVTSVARLRATMDAALHEVK